MDTEDKREYMIDTMGPQKCLSRCRLPMDLDSAVFEATNKEYRQPVAVKMFAVRVVS